MCGVHFTEVRVGQQETHAIARLSAFEMRCYGKLLRVKWTDKREKSFWRSEKTGKNR